MIYGNDTVWDKVVNLCCSYGSIDKNEELVSTRKCTELDNNNNVESKNGLNDEKRLLCDDKIGNYYYNMNEWTPLEDLRNLDENIESGESIVPSSYNDEDSDSLKSYDKRQEFDEKDEVDEGTVAASEVGKNLEGIDADNDDVELDEAQVNCFGNVLATIRYTSSNRTLSIQTMSVNQIPGKLEGGASEYLLCISVFDDKNNKLSSSWRSKRFTVVNHASSSSTRFIPFEQMDLSEKNLPLTAVRFRLYGCERKHRDILLGEAILGLANIKAIMKNNPVTIYFEKRASLKNSKMAEAMKRAISLQNSPKALGIIKTIKSLPLHRSHVPSNTTQKQPRDIKNNSPATKSINSHGKSSVSSSVSNYFRSQSCPNKSINPFNKKPSQNYVNEAAAATSSGLASGKTTDQVSVNVADKGETIAELNVGLAYNAITGRLTVEIVKGNAFRNPIPKDEDKLPTSFVKITISAANNQELDNSKTELQKSQANPLFHEKFMFHVPQFQLGEVTVMFAVYHRKSISRKDLIGWFSIGLHNSSEEEKSHWQSMTDANGGTIYQSHILQPNTVSRSGIPGAK